MLPKSGNFYVWPDKKVDFGLSKCFLNSSISTSSLIKWLILGLGFISRGKLLSQNASRWAPTLLYLLHELVNHQFEPYRLIVDE